MPPREQLDTLSDDALRSLIREQNLRIEGANSIRRKIAGWALGLGIGSFVLAAFALGPKIGKDGPLGCVLAIFWAGCAVVFWLTKEEGEHWEHRADGEDEVSWRWRMIDLILKAREERDRSRPGTSNSSWQDM